MAYKYYKTVFLKQADYLQQSKVKFCHVSFCVYTTNGNIDRVRPGASWCLAWSMAIYQLDCWNSTIPWLGECGVRVTVSSCWALMLEALYIVFYLFFRWGLNWAWLFCSLWFQSLQIIWLAPWVCSCTISTAIVSKIRHASLLWPTFKARWSQVRTKCWHNFLFL